MKLIECPRDAMQGFSSFIPTKIKIKYINELLKVGFDTIDVGSFVSKRQIPQLADTKEVLQSINLKDTKSKLLVITGNLRGAEEAAGFDEVTYIGFPFSISESFQKKNINSSINDSLVILDKIQNLCVKKNKKLVTYFSMAFGNPYGDEWSTYIVAHWAEKLLKDFGINILSLSDTIGSSDPSSISWLFSKLIREFPEVEFGAHLHSNSKDVKEKINAAYLAGCRRFDGALMGIGGCPMAKDQLIGNMPTEKIIDVLSNSGERLEINHDVLKTSLDMAKNIFI
ncbi:MAG: hydroxymethylglutaryl-CoA lyase [Flavobacteriales bacterium]|nr:hydroxymethylglutaryl-CoA lyase [Flavobacteriales bacterium]MDG1797985.1 hydroxymethylglutaryl-CoA lyase [Flavobacteriales bacterium]